MPSQALFPTLVYKAPLQASGWKSFNDRLLLECRQYREDDSAGQAWSATRYPGGYTSYGSLEPDAHDLADVRAAGAQVAPARAADSRGRSSSTSRDANSR